MKEQELENLQALFEQANTETQELALPLLNNAKFMSSELDKLMQTITAEGWTCDYWNGKNQRGKIESAEGKAYHKLIKDFNTTVKNLQALLEKTQADTEEEDEFMQYIHRRNA